MNLLNNFKNMSQLEKVLGALFVLFIVLPVEVPSIIANLVDNTLGMVGLFILGVYMYLHVSPVLAVLFVFVAYELLRRCCKTTGKAIIMKHTPTQAKKDEKMKKMNPPKKETLEEQVVDQMAPIGKSEIASYVSTTFKPVAEDVGTASVF